MLYIEEINVYKFVYFTFNDVKKKIIKNIIKIK